MYLRIAYQSVAFYIPASFMGSEFIDIREKGERNELVRDLQYTKVAKTKNIIAESKHSTRPEKYEQ